MLLCPCFLAFLAAGGGQPKAAKLRQKLGLAELAELGPKKTAFGMDKTAAFHGFGCSWEVSEG